MSLYPDTVAAHLDDGQAVDTQDIRCTERAQAGTGIEATGPHPPAVSLAEYCNVHSVDEAVMHRGFMGKTS